MYKTMIRLLVLCFTFYIANAQWRGEIGHQQLGRNWELRGGARYEINRGRTRANVGGHGFINSNGQRGWGVSGGVKGTFGRGRGSYGVQGFRNSNGNYGARATLRYRWGRRRRSVPDDDQMKQICSECFSIERITSEKKLQEYTDAHNVQFGMVAKFKRFYQGENETMLKFKIKQIIESPLSDLNISEAKVFNIYADSSTCALFCLRDLVRENYIVTGAMFHGRLIIHDKLLLLSIINQDKGATRPDVEDDASDDEDEEADNSEGAEDDGDTDDKDAADQEVVDDEDEDTEDMETKKDSNSTNDKDISASVEELKLNVTGTLLDDKLTGKLPMPEVQHDEDNEKDASGDDEDNRETEEDDKDGDDKDDDDKDDDDKDDDDKNDDDKDDDDKKDDDKDDDDEDDDGDNDERKKRTVKTTKMMVIKKIRMRRTKRGAKM